MSCKYYSRIVFLITALILVAGCASISEITKSSWGSSTRALQNARADAVSRVYECQYDICFEQVRGVLGEEEISIFISDLEERLMIAMNIPLCVSTTEVGIFFVQEAEDKIKIEISSLSPKAKRIASELIFLALDELYNN